MIEKCQLTATEISKLDVLNPATVSKAISGMESLKATRLIITDRKGLRIYDSANPMPQNEQYLLLPEIVEALSADGNLGYNAFTWSYHDGDMQSRAATPIISYGTIIGCVYMTEQDTSQGALIKTLQKTTLFITLTLEFALIAFSLFFSCTYSKRLRKITDSMRIIRQGDYTHKVSIGGSDELTMLGKEFNDLVERLKESEQKRNNFVSDASHELKTPLASIKLLSDSILQNDMDTEMVREFVADIGSEADRLNRMSQKLLSLSRIESQADSDCEIVFIAPTVERVVRMLSENAQNSNITVSSNLQDDCSILILEDDLYQIVFNLVENGIKYNNPGGTLTIALHHIRDDAVLTVQDSGMGIPEDSLEHIFERFYRVDKARARKTGGSGLGLSIVRNMVERNGGTITAASKEGEGTCFTVTFPVFDMEDEV